MKKIKSLCYTALVTALFALTGCKHEIIQPPVSNTPVFNAIGTIGDDPVNLSAGVDQVTLSSNNEVVDGVQVYRGTLGGSNVEFAMELYDGNIDLTTKPIQELTSATEFYFTPNTSQPLLSITKNAFQNASSIQSISWTVNGNPQIQQNDLRIFNPGKYDVCANVTFEDQSKSTICNQIIVGFRKNANYNLNFILGQDGSFRSWLKIISGTISSVKWYVNDNLINQEGFFNYDSLEMYKNVIRAEAIFTNNAKKVTSVLLDKSAGNHIFDYTNYGDLTNYIWDHKVRISVKKNGEIYTSQNAYNEQNKVTVEEIKFHNINSQGNPVYILKGKVVALLTKDGSNETYPLNLNISMGFVIPQ